jgi:hypothetical protein
MNSGTVGEAMEFFLHHFLPDMAEWFKVHRSMLAVVLVFADSIYVQGRHIGRANSAKALGPRESGAPNLVVVVL